MRHTLNPVLFISRRYCWMSYLNCHNREPDHEVLNWVINRPRRRSQIVGSQLQPLLDEFRDTLHYQMHLLQSSDASLPLETIPKTMLRITPKYVAEIQRHMLPTPFKHAAGTSGNTLGSLKHTMEIHWKTLRGPTRHAVGSYAAGTLQTRSRPSDTLRVAIKYDAGSPKIVLAIKKREKTAKFRPPGGLFRYPPDSRWKPPDRLGDRRG